jgi:flagellar hook protein FlgE
MGLASALTTAQTGLSAAETKIDVVGNNLANAQTVAFKESDIVFATQFLQTFSLGSAPTAANGGTNPKQTGLGVQVAEITPDFSQGTIELSGNASDLAIQGDGFFIVESTGGEQLYTRAGIFKTNAANELVTPDGGRLLGYGIDDEFRIQESGLVPLEIPLGAAASAQATTQVRIEGNLTPTAEVADTAQVIESAVLGDASIPQADIAGVTIGPAPVPSVGSLSINHVEGGGTHPEGAIYQYKFVYVDSSGTEAGPSSQVSVTVPAGDTLANNTIQLNSLPPATGSYSDVRIYRTVDGGSDFFLLGNAAAGGNFIDDNSGVLSTPLNENQLTGNYGYMITYAAAGHQESRPSPLMGPINVINGRVQIDSLPTPPTPGLGDTFPPYTDVKIYRNLANSPDTYYLVGTGTAGQSFTDNRTDAEISDLSNPSNGQLDLDGPKLTNSTLLVNVIRRTGYTYEQVFPEGTLSFNHTKGERVLGVQEFEITDQTTVQELLEFMNEATGVLSPGDDPLNPIPTSVNRIPGESGTLSAGAVLNDGRIRFVSNNGDVNAVDLPLSAFSVAAATGDTINPNLGFSEVQEARGQGAIADFVAYDTLGVPLNVRITTVLEEINGTNTVYRWYAESADNDSLNPATVALGTGRISFDGQGDFIDVTNELVSLERRNSPAFSPLEFKLDFSPMSGLASEEPQMTVARQDGSPPGTLTDFVIGEDGLVQGVFDNGTTKDLGQIRMAKFANPNGLEQRGQNMYANGINAGLSFANPGEDGAGALAAGALELSNSDVGRNLVELVLASTLYRGNTRVINTAQELLDELMNLRR